jgi:hypothetical protein
VLDAVIDVVTDVAVEDIAEIGLDVTGMLVDVELAAATLDTACPATDVELAPAPPAAVLLPASPLRR